MHISLYSNTLNECITTHQQGTHTTHSTASRIQDMPLWQQQHNLHSNMPYRLSTACAVLSFCIQEYLPCSLAIKYSSDPQRNSLSMHINMHYIHSQLRSTAFNNPPIHATNKHKISIAKWHSSYM